MDLQGSRVLVTGGAGLIGSHIVDLLLEHSSRVRILDNLEPQTHPQGRPAWIPAEAEFVLGDLRDPNAVLRALEGIDLVFHQAAFGGFTSEMTKYADVNTTGTVRLFEIIRNQKLPIKKIVVASSQAVYGEGTYRCSEHGLQYPGLRPIEQLRRREWEVRCPECEKPLQPVGTKEEKRKDGSTIYALTKASEEWALSFGKALGIPVVVLRYAVTYGPRQSIYNAYTGVVSIFSARLLSGHPPVAYEDGMQSRDFIYVGDVARANLFVMEHETADFQLFNVGTGKPTSIQQLAHELASLYGMEIQPELRGAFRLGDVRHFIHDSSKLYALGWFPQVTLTEGLRKFKEWVETQSGIQDYFESAERVLRRAGVVIETQ